MASGDVVLKTTGGFQVGAYLSAPGSTSLLVQLLINGVAASVPANGNVTSLLVSGFSPVVLSVFAGGAVQSSPFNPAKTYDITITEH